MLCPREGSSEKSRKSQVTSGEGSTEETVSVTTHKQNFKSKENLHKIDYYHFWPASSDGNKTKHLELIKDFLHTERVKPIL